MASLSVDKTELLESKILAAVKLIGELRVKNAALSGQVQKLAQENEFLLSENNQVRRIMGELDRLREERNAVRHKCEKLIAQYEKMKL